MPKYIIKSWEGGISSWNDRGQHGASKFIKNVDIRKQNDSLSCGQALKEDGLYGFSHSQSASLSPSASLSQSRSASSSVSPSNSPSRSQSPSSSASASASRSSSPSASSSPSSSVSASPSASSGLGNVYLDLVLFWVKASDGHLYGFGDTGHIYRRYSDGFTRLVYTDPDGKIRGAIEKPSSNGTTYLQWATAWKLKQKAIPGSSNWTDVSLVAENLTSTDWHTMKQVGGANYIANGSRVALVGYDDSYTNEALNIIPGRYIKTIVERNGRAVFGSYPAGYPNKGVNGAIDCEVPLMQIGDDGELFYSDFSSTMPVKRFPGGGRVNPGGVTNEVESIEIFDWVYPALSWVDRQTLGNMSLWGVFNGDSGKNGVYTYGRKNKEQLFTMNLEYEMDVDEIGAVINYEGVTIASYRDGSVYGVKAVDSENKAEGVWEGLEFRLPERGAERPAIVNYVEIFMKKLPYGCRVKFYYQKNKTGTWTQAMTADGNDAYTIQNGKKATFRIGDDMDIYEPRIVMTPYGNETPEIYRITTYFNA